MPTRSPKRVVARLLLVGTLLAGFVVPAAAPAQAAIACHTLMTKGRAFTAGKLPYKISMHATRCGSETQSISISVDRTTKVTAKMGTTRTTDDLVLTSSQTHYYSFYNLTNTTFSLVPVNGEPLSKAKVNVASQIAPHGAGDALFTSPAANPVRNDCKTADGKVRSKHRDGSMSGDLLLNTNTTAFGKIIVANGTPATLYWSDGVACGPGGGEPTPTCDTNSTYVSAYRDNMSLSASRNAGAKRAQLFSYNHNKIKTTRTATDASVLRMISQDVPAANVSMTFDAAGAPKTSSVKGYPGMDIIGGSSFTASTPYPGEWRACPLETSTAKQDRSDVSFGKLTAPSSGGLTARFFMGGNRAVSTKAMEANASRSRVRATP